MIMMSFFCSVRYCGLHCENGPAILLEDGTKKWYLFGKEYTEEEFEAALIMKAFW